MVYSTEQHAFLVKRFYQTASVITVQHEVQLEMVMDTNGADTKLCLHDRQSPKTNLEPPNTVTFAV
jgi:hypothetical protein